MQKIKNRRGKKKLDLATNNQINQIIYLIFYIDIITKKLKGSKTKKLQEKNSH